MLTFGFVSFNLPEIDFDIVSAENFRQGHDPNMRKTPFKSLSYVTMSEYLLVTDFDGEKVYKLNDDLANS